MVAYARVGVAAAGSRRGLSRNSPCKGLAKGRAKGRLVKAVAPCTRLLLAGLSQRQSRAGFFSTKAQKQRWSEPAPREVRSCECSAAFAPTTAQCSSVGSSLRAIGVAVRDLNLNCFWFESPLFSPHKKPHASLHVGPLLRRRRLLSLPGCQWALHLG